MEKHFIVSPPKNDKKLVILIIAFEFKLHSNQLEETFTRKCLMKILVRCVGSGDKVDNQWCHIFDDSPYTSPSQNIHQLLKSETVTKTYFLK